MAGVRREVGNKRSFRIEAKRFDIELEVRGPSQVKFSESGRHHQCAIQMGRDGAQWLGRCIAENITGEKDRAFVHTFLENGKTYVNRRESNSFERFIDVTECGRGGRRGRIVIPEGKRQSGWRGFLMELQLLLDPENRDKPPGNKKVEFVSTQGNHGEKSYAATVIEGGLKPPEKIVRKFDQRVERDNVEQAVVITAVPSNGKGKKSNGEKSDEIPQFVTPVKKRSPLQFFPNVAPRRDHRDYGKGLVITLKENGYRIVSRNISTHASLNNHGLPRMESRPDFKSGFGPTKKNGKWVPWVTQPLQVNGLSTKISPGKPTLSETVLESPVGSRNRPTFEVGESSTKRHIGLGPKPHPPVQAFTEIKTSSSLELSSVSAIETTRENLRGASSSSNRKLLGRKWSIQLRNRGRMAIMGLEHSPWDFVRSNYGEGFGRWWWGMFEPSFASPMVQEQVVEAVLGVLHGENQEWSVIPVDDCSGALVIEPLAVDCSMAE